jgi:hypothetical protein
MTEWKPDERRPHPRDEEDQAEVEGHRFDWAEKAADHERRPHPVNEDEVDDEGKAGRAAP